MLTFVVFENIILAEVSLIKLILAFVFLIE